MQNKKTTHFLSGLLDNGYHIVQLKGALY